MAFTKNKNEGFKKPNFKKKNFKTNNFQNKNFVNIKKTENKPFLKPKITPLDGGKFEVLHYGKTTIYNNQNELTKFKETLLKSQLADTICFNCREKGHRSTNCPNNSKSGKAKSICYHCGKSDHNIYQCTAEEKKFAFSECFVCKELGHLSKDCPKNTKGVYPDGGCCHLCSQTDHKKINCPLLKTIKKTVETKFETEALVADFENPEF